MDNINETNTITADGQITTVPFARIHRSHPRFDEVFRFYRTRGAGLSIVYGPGQELLARQDNEDMDLPLFQSITTDVANARKIAARFITKKWFFKYEHERGDRHKFTFSSAIDLVRDLTGLKFVVETSIASDLERAPIPHKHLI